MKNLEDIADLKECSFQPRVNKSNSPMRNVSTYVRDQETYELSK